MSENTAFNKEEKRDLDILNKMKKNTGWSGHNTFGYSCSYCNIFPKCFSDWWVCNSIIL